MSLPRVAGRLLLEAYPEPWRDRYRVEMLALLEDDPPGMRGLASLLVGAADAHLHPQPAWSEKTSALARLRLSVGAMFACWIALSLAGAGFQKTTEEPAFAAVADRHPLLAIAHDAILAGALLGAVAIAFGGIPLLWRAIWLAAAERDRRLTRLLALPALAVIGFLGLTRLLIAVAPARDGGFPAAFVLATALPWLLAMSICVLVCALTPRVVLRRIAPPRVELRRAFLAGLVLALAMCVITCALIAYELSLCLQAPALSAGLTGPLGVSTATMLAAQFLLAVVSTGLALRSAVRARTAVTNRARTG